MPSSPEDRLRVAAVISALKAAGVRVKNWKNFLNGEATHGDTYKQERRCNIFAFGRDLALLPQCNLPEMGGAVPRFLVDACEFLSQHLHTEGLFRKTGSLSRIRALRVGLEQGEPVFSPPLSSSLQPCDVASLLKQFLRELPSPLIPPELQGALCRAQGLGPRGGREGGRNGPTLLVTALFPTFQARALRYLCTFLRRAAQRCSENRMEVGSLALLMAPNLLQGLTAGCKLTVGTERLLDRQAAVITALITHAERIGVIPSVVMEALAGAEGAGFQEKAGLGVYRSVRRQRRRSVGEMFVDAFSKLKTGRAPNAPSQPDTAQGQQGAAVAVPQSPCTTKRKASQDTVPEVEGSAKKRRSIHDLRVDAQPTSLSCSDDSESPLSQSPTPSLCSVTSGLEASDEHHLLAPQTASAKKRNHRRNTKRVQRVPAPEDRAQRRRRSLRFFTTGSWSGSSTAPSDGIEADNWLLGTKRITDNLQEPPSCEGVRPFQPPVILIDGPGGVVVGSEVEDDPDTLNCSFVESPPTMPVSSRRVWSAAQREGEGEGERRAPGTGATVEPGEETNGPAYGREEGVRPVGEASERNVGSGGWRDPVADVFRRVSRGYRPPRRSISLPEVTSDQAGDQGEEEEEGADKFGGSDFHNCRWSVEDPMKDSEEVLQNGLDKRRVTEREKKGKKEEKRRAGKAEESGLGFVRSHQRMSVADRMRRFNLLSAWLRAPSRPTPVPPSPQRGPVRLRRQGARRFSRSVSHEAVAELLQEHSTLTTKPLPQSQEHCTLTAKPPPQSQEHCTLTAKPPPQSQEHSTLTAKPPPQSQEHCTLTAKPPPQSQEHSTLTAKPPPQSQEHSTLTAKPPPQSQDLLKHRDLDPPPNPMNPFSLSNPVKPQNCMNPPSLLKPASPPDIHSPVNCPNPLHSCNFHNPQNLLNPSIPLNCPNPLSPSNHNPLNPGNPVNPAIPHNPPEAVSPQNPLNPLTPPFPLEHMKPPRLSFRPPKPPRRHPSRRLPPVPGGQPFRHGQRLKQPQQDPGRPPQPPKPQPKPEGESGSPEPDLHELLELQLRIQHLQSLLEHPVSQSALCSAPPPKPARSPCFLSLPPPPPHHNDARSHRAPALSPPTWPLTASNPCCPLLADRCIGSAPEMGDRHCARGLNGTGTGGGDLSPSLSPPLLHLRLPTARRRYRDSPRWPIPEIHITSLTPYQL
ncbi:LOW QUALITY PROTEIN: uncharacterized protein zgc:153345 [Conger conger]|uniref:LOW QUALITY PROTEIN: uncharacterized protein zgc:153345 n=1 Tax=Conger conger TaxID=82655 RepID=UPI002A5AE166|nr:LOW QUALITY PROTEIN: uncharacterized protein zgc:153345 [Conger conger]